MSDLENFFAAMDAKKKRKKYKGAKGKRKAKGSKKKKAKGGKKRKLNPYAAFVKANFKRVARAHPSMKAQSVMRKLAALWRSKH